MKVFISADIEGVTGATHWDETNHNHPAYTQIQEQMTAETAAACEAAIEAGAQEVWVKDAHATARNLIPSRLPQKARLIRGWTGHPYSMVQELDETFQAAIFIGYHSRAGMDSSPLAHTMTGGITRMKLNDRFASEFLLHTYAAALTKTPVVFVSGDQGLADEVSSLNPNIGVFATKTGKGSATINVHPALSVSRIHDGVVKALGGNLSKCLIELPSHFRLEIQYKEHADATHAAYYPGASLKEPHVVQYETDDYFEIMRMISFTL